MEKLNITLAYTTEGYMFESEFDQATYHAWMKQNWTKSIWYSAIYVLLVIIGQKWMESRPKYSLRLPLIIWSSCLAVFSILGTVRTLPELTYMLRKYGFDESICDNSFLYGHVSFWVYLFVMSKVYELGDTVFIILRKQRLVFLHWYHHATVLMYVWYSITCQSGPGRWFMVMNYAVHSFMYTYYAARAMGFRPPTWINMTITTGQICQMMMGVGIVLRIYHLQTQGRPCNLEWTDRLCCLLMYASYLGLFAHFFYNSYLQPKQKAVKSNGLHKTKENGKIE